MLTFKKVPAAGDPPTFRVFIGANELGTISNPGPGPGTPAWQSWRGLSPDGTRFAATSKPKIAEQLLRHARKAAGR